MFGLFSPPSRKKFVKLLLAELQKRGSSATYEFHEAEFLLTRGGEKIWLENVYSSYCEAKGDHRRRILDNFVGMMAVAGDSDIEVPWTKAAPLLMSGVRETVIFDFMTSYTATGDAEKKLEQIRRPFTRWFSQTLLLDAPTHVAYVGPAQLKGWNVKPEEAFELGLHNLRERSAPHFRLENDIFIGAWQDDYDSSRLLLPEIFAGLPLNGKPVIAAPNRLTLLVTGDRDIAAVQRLLALAEKVVREQPKPQNPSPLTIEDGQVVDFHVPANSPLAPAVQRANGITALMYYQDQQRVLDEYHEKTGKDIYVGKYTLLQRPDGGYHSYAVWSYDVVTLLPEVDVVEFYDARKPKGSEGVASVPWARVLAVLGDQMLDTKLFPPRFYVNTFPTPEQFAAMSAAQ